MFGNRLPKITEHLRNTALHLNKPKKKCNKLKVAHQIEINLISNFLT